jgi:hypothetical protein
MDPRPESRGAAGCARGPVAVCETPLRTQLFSKWVNIPLGSTLTPA